MNLTKAQLSNIILGRHIYCGQEILCQVYSASIDRSRDTVDTKFCKDVIGRSTEKKTSLCMCVSVCMWERVCVRREREMMQSETDIDLILLEIN